MNNNKFILVRRCWFGVPVGLITDHEIKSVTKIKSRFVQRLKIELYYYSMWAALLDVDDVILISFLNKYKVYEVSL